MNGALQSKIAPPTANRGIDLSDAAVKDTAALKAKDSNAAKSQVSFKDLLLNSNDEAARSRAAQKNGGPGVAKNDEEFAKAMQDKINKENQRRPQNNLDKDAFLKLFITQMQSQDPINPQDSSEMASQLAQFHSLEQMLNVNKNLEKMASDQANSRAVSLINFVGKEVKLNGGKLKLAGGHLGKANFQAERPIPDATLEVRDTSGTVVATKSLGSIGDREQQLVWDGIDDAGKRLADGIYTFAIVGKDVQGTETKVNISSIVKITGVDLTEQGGSFYSDLGKVRVGEIATIGTSGFAELPNQSSSNSAPPESPSTPGGTTTKGATSDPQNQPATAGPIPVANANPNPNQPQGQDAAKRAPEDQEQATKGSLNIPIEFAKPGESPSLETGESGLGALPLSPSATPNHSSASS